MAYFAFHAVQGRHGLEARARLKAQGVALAEQIARLETSRITLERDARLLAPETLDLDLLEEVARSLGFSRPGDRLLAPGRARQP
jgi:cell division protein FtsB